MYYVCILYIVYIYMMHTRRTHTHTCSYTDASQHLQSSNIEGSRAGTISLGSIVINAPDPSVLSLDK